MKFFLVILLLASPQAFSALNMKPGLWNVKMNMKTGGKEINPSAEIEKAMAQMPEAQKKKMQDMMGKMKAAPAQDGGMNVCYSKAMLEKPEKLGTQKDKECDTKVITQTSSKVVTNFKCEDGTKGDGTWKITSSSAYTGLMNIVSPKGEKSQINYTANFLATDCGKVQPIL
jgi:hypothetical protein